MQLSFFVYFYFYLTSISSVSVSSVVRDYKACRSDPSYVPSSSVAVPSSLLIAVWGHAQHLARYEQHDSHEFFLALVDGLVSHLEMNHNDIFSLKRKRRTEIISDLSCGMQVTSEEPKEWEKEDRKRVRNLVTDPFTGMMVSKLVCKTCNHTSCKYESYIDVGLNLDFSLSEVIDGDSGSNGKGNVYVSDCESYVDLLDCFKNYTRSETLSETLFCDNCNDKSIMSKQLSLRTLPKTLVLHLKRFDATKQSKIGTNVRFPLYELDLAYMMNSNTCTDGDIDFTRQCEFSIQDPKSNKYDLVGMVCHYGTLNQVPILGTLLLMKKSIPRILAHENFRPQTIYTIIGSLHSVRESKKRRSHLSRRKGSCNCRSRV